MFQPKLYSMRGVAVTAVRLTKDNVTDVYTWVDGKYFFDPKETAVDGIEWYEGSDLHITGLGVFTPDGKVKANWGDWVVRLPRGRFIVLEHGPFEAECTLVAG